MDWLFSNSQGGGVLDKVNGTTKGEVVTDISAG